MALARAAVNMSRAHEQHQPNARDRRTYGCKGIKDPLTGHWCQFSGTAQEQHLHVVERVTAAMEAVLDAHPEPTVS